MIKEGRVDSGPRQTFRSGGGWGEQNEINIGAGAECGNFVSASMESRVKGIIPFFLVFYLGGEGGRR